MLIQSAIFHSLVQALPRGESMARAWARLAKKWLAGTSTINSSKYNPREHWFTATADKVFTMKNRVLLIAPSGKALCLLKTQFAKKPKNPV
jgi:hypothetical protein